jgi:hypothetical protein
MSLYSLREHSTRLLLKNDFAIHDFSNSFFLTNLLALAIKNRGKPGTFDQRIDPSLLQGGISSYHVIKDDSGV